jgi:hypothetical protein
MLVLATATAAPSELANLTSCFLFVLLPAFQDGLVNLFVSNDELASLSSARRATGKRARLEAIAAA